MKSYIKFIELPTRKGKKTYEWAVQADSGFILGNIQWYNPWRRYCFYPSGMTIFDVNCLKEITTFIEEEMAEHKADLKLAKDLKNNPEVTKLM